MKYEEAVEYLLKIPRFSKKTSGENLEEILKRLGNPQEKMKSIHVAGTNGKGSVCAFLNSILIGAGKKTGLFTSPHLVKVNERMKLNGRDISDEEFCETFCEVLVVVKEMDKEGYAHPSFFEFLFIMAAVIFHKNNMEYAIYEVGLGGRLDATNILKNPALSVITSISLDHTEILGDTIGKIATEKAGIIKEHVPVIFYHSSEESTQIIKNVANSKHADLYMLSDEDIKLNEISSKDIDFSIDSMYYNCGNVKVSFPAEYQAVNCSLALLAFQIIRQLDKTFGDTIHPERLVQGTRWEGRMEQVKKNIFFDGAHNISGISEFVKSAKRMECKGRKLLLFSVVVEKDYTHMIERLMEDNLWDGVFIAQMHNKRAVDKEEIKRIFKNTTRVKTDISDNVREAFSHAVAVKREDDILFCTGSLYLVGELKEYLEVYDD